MSHINISAARKLPQQWADGLHAAIIESSEDAIVSKFLDGSIMSWNAAAERLFGYTADEIVGRSILTLIPEDRHHEEVDIISRLKRGERIEHIETVRRHKSGAPLEVALTISPIRDSDGTIIGASKMARNIGAQKEAERRLARQTERLATLNRIATDLAKDLDFDRIVGAVVESATQVSGAQFGAFFYNVVDDAGESYLLYALHGAERSQFENFGMPRNTAIFAPTFAGEATIVSDDIRKDPRYGQSAPHHGMPKGHLPVVSYLAVPVRLPSGEVLGGLFFAHSEPGRFDEEGAAAVEGIAAHGAVAMENARLHRAAQLEIEQRKAAEYEKELLFHEIKHRVKNTLATIQAIASQTFTTAPEEEIATFSARIQALGGAHDMLSVSEWSEVPLLDVVERAMRPFQDQGAARIAIDVPALAISAQQALALALALHELATNAVKYGALSAPEGRVSLSTRMAEHAGEEAIELSWEESGGPPVAPPSRRGFGSKMIERALSGHRGKVELHFVPTGLICRLCLPLAGEREPTATAS